MITIHPEKRTITPEKAVRILKRHGQKVSLKEARLMLDLMYDLAILSLNQVLKDQRMQELWNDQRQQALREQYKKR